MSDDNSNKEDISEPIYNENGRRLPKTAWGKGCPSPNAKGRPKAGTEKTLKGKPRSKMRSTLSKLYDLEQLACDVIKEHLEGTDKRKTDEEKSRLDVAKFVIKSIESLNNTCLREELAVIGLREKNKEAADDVEESQSVADTVTSNFSMELAEETLVKH